jgi:hypothetical protein
MRVVEGKFIRGEVVHTRREIDLRFDARFHRGIVLFAEKIEAQMRTDFSNFGWMVAQAMVTL